MQRAVSCCPRLALLGLGVVLALWLLAAPVQANGGGIEVLDDRHEAGAPGELNFTLTAEGEEEIVEARLFYRTLVEGVWSYAYFALNPGRHVTARLDLSIAGFSYLSPGAELEYYYVIRDAQGNVHQTATQVFEYVDNRFQWEKTQVGPLLLLYHDLSQSRVAAVTRKVEEALDRISSILQMETAGPIRGVIYNSDAEARDVFPRQSQTTTDAEVFGGFAFPPNGVFVGIGLETRIIVHESAHLLLDQAVGPDALPLPAWLNEGFASYAEPGSTFYSGQSLNSQGLPLRAMTRVSGAPQSIFTFYRKAGSVVSYMIEEFGVEPFQRLLGELAKGSTTEDALTQAYGFGVTELEARWASDASRPPAPAPGFPAGGISWVNFSSVVMGALAVVVMLLVVFRHAVRKLRPTDGPEDGLQPWEDPDLLEREEDYRP